MSNPSVARRLAGIARPDPRQVRWDPLDLARRRALTTARAELEAAERRRDHSSVVAAWHAVVEALERTQGDR